MALQWIAATDKSELGFKRQISAPNALKTLAIFPILPAVFAFSEQKFARLKLQGTSLASIFEGFLSAEGAKI